MEHNKKRSLDKESTSNDLSESLVWPTSRGSFKDEIALSVRAFFVRKALSLLNDQLENWWEKFQRKEYLTVTLPTKEVFQEIACFAKSSGHQVNNYELLIEGVFSEEADPIRQEISRITSNKQQSFEFSLVPTPKKGLNFSFKGRDFSLRYNRINQGTSFVKKYYIKTKKENKKTLRSLIKEITLNLKKKKEESVGIYNFTQWCKWEESYRKYPRKQKDVVLQKEGPKTIDDLILDDAREFINEEEWYHKHGIPYRRVYMFHGPPGTGKSTFAEVMAGELSMDLYQLDLSSSTHDSVNIQGGLRSVPPYSIILFEDIDHMFQDSRLTDGKGDGQGISLSSLLNAIDGIAAQEGRIVVMTTNNFDVLNKAMKRGGRIDVKHYFGHCTPNQIERFFLKFYPGETGLAKKVASSLEKQKVPPSDVQNIFQKYKSNPSKACDAVCNMLKKEAQGER